MVLVRLTSVAQGRNKVGLGWGDVGEKGVQGYGGGAADSQFYREDSVLAAPRQVSERSAGDEHTSEDGQNGQKRTSEWC